MRAHAVGHRSSGCTSGEPRVRTQEAAGGLGPGVGVWLAGAGKEDHWQGRRAETGPGHGMVRMVGAYVRSQDSIPITQTNTHLGATAQAFGGVVTRRL